MSRCVISPQERAEFELGWQAVGVTCIFQNAGEDGQDPLRLLKRLGRFTYLTDRLRDFLGGQMLVERILETINSLWPSQ